MDRADRADRTDRRVFAFGLGAAAFVFVVAVQLLCVVGCAALTYWILTSNGTDPNTAVLFAVLVTCLCCCGHATADAAH